MKEFMQSNQNNKWVAINISNNLMSQLNLKMTHTMEDLQEEKHQVKLWVLEEEEDQEKTLISILNPGQTNKVAEMLPIIKRLSLFKNMKFLKRKKLTMSLV